MLLKICAFKHSNTKIQSKIFKSIQKKCYPEMNFHLIIHLSSNTKKKQNVVIVKKPDGVSLPWVGQGLVVAACWGRLACQA